MYAEELTNAFAGRTADGTRSLVQEQKWKDRERQPAWDITLSVPKWLSVLWSCSGIFNRDRIEQVVLAAAKRAVDYLDAEALIARRGNKGNYIEHAKGIWALCPHGTSRAKDPQLHIHCLAMNLCVRSDGTTGAIRSWDLYVHKMAAGAIFRTELAYLLKKELGLRVRQDGWKLKLDDVPEELCREQSKGRKAIEAVAKEEGWNSPRVLAEIAARIRAPKGDLSLPECFEHWQEAAAKYGFTREVTESLLSRARQHHAEAVQSLPKVETLGRIISRSVRDLSAYKAYFSERDLVRTAATHAQARGYSASDVLNAVKQGLGHFEHEVTKRDSAYLHYATKKNIAEERQLIDRAISGRLSNDHIVATDVVTAAKSKVEKKMAKAAGLPITFTKDQEQALRFITQEPGDVKPVQGFAGTGKTQMLEAAHLAWKQGGRHVIGVTITGRAAIVLQNATEIPSVTVALFLQMLNPSMKSYVHRSTHTLKDAVREAYYDSLAAGRWVQNPWKAALQQIERSIRDIGQAVPRRMPNVKLTSKSIVVLDEAAMVPTGTLLAIKKQCDKVGAKLVLIGDRLQLPAIEAGGPFWSLATRLGHASLTTIVRQREPWMREAVEHLIADQPLRALKLYAANDALHLEPHRRAAIEKLTVDYAKILPRDLPKAIALTTTNEEAHDINERLQRKRKASRQLGFSSLKLSNGERVYKNDRVLLTLNDYKLGVRNGFLGTVEAVHCTRGVMGPGSITVRLDDLKTKGLFAHNKQSVTIDLKKYPAVQLGYAVTTHKIQGVTKERSFVLLGDAMLSKEMSFTQLTRASHMTQLYGTEAQYGDSVALLSKQMERKTAKDLAHDHSIQPRKKRECELSHEQSQSL